MQPAEPSAPSALLVSRLPALRDCARLGPIVDLGCGRGRHARWLAAEGLPVIAIDRNRKALRELAGEKDIRPVLADLESGHGIPLVSGSCGAILVFRFLFRPLAEAIEAALAPSGLLLYETFTRAQRSHGWGPKRDAFLLEQGELPRLFPGLEILHYDEGPAPGSRTSRISRISNRTPKLNPY